MQFLSVIAVSTVCLFCCACEEEIGNSKDVNQETIYLDYNITQQNTTDADILLCFRFAGPNGTTLVLNEPSNVKLDGVRLRIDSSYGMGAYYETAIPYHKLTGIHEIVFTDYNGKAYTNNFKWNNMTCNTAIADRIFRQELFIPVNGGIDGDELDIVVSDTSADSNEASLVLKIKKGGIQIPADAFAVQIEGPIDITISKNTDSKLKHTTAEGGHIKISQHIKTLTTILSSGKAGQE